MNKAEFAALDPAVQEAVLKAAAEAEKRGWQMSKAEADTKTKILAENGIKVVPPSDALMAGLRKIGEKMLADTLANASEATKKIVAAYQGG